MRSNFAKDHTMMECIVYDSLSNMQRKIHSFLVFILYVGAMLSFVELPIFVENVYI